MVFNVKRDNFRGRTVWSRNWDIERGSHLRGIWTYRVQSTDGWSTTRMQITYASRNQGRPTVYLRGGKVAPTALVGVDVDCSRYSCTYEYILEVEVTEDMTSGGDFALMIDNYLLEIGSSKTLDALHALDDEIERAA